MEKIGNEEIWHVNCVLRASLASIEMVTDVELMTCFGVPIDMQSGGGEGGFMGMMSGLASQFIKAKLDSDNPEEAASYTAAANSVHPSSARAMFAGLRPSASHRAREDAGILLSGCQHNETSADATPAGGHSQSYGAFSNALIGVLAQHEGPITNWDLVTKIRESLGKTGFKQHPCLFCTDGNAQQYFICPT